MSFYGSSFIFDGVPSELYNLRILDFNPSNPGNSPAGGSVNIKEEWLYRREAPYYYGRYYQEPLEFDLTVGSFSPIDGATRSAINGWMVGKTTYAPLRIVQDDISDIVYNVILTKSEHIYVGNLNYAMTFHARCDRPWGLYYPPVFSQTFSGEYSSLTFDYMNSSIYSGYNKPIISFSMGGSSASPLFFSLINHTDEDREFKFTGLNTYETITVDNDKGIITSDIEILRMANFNKKFFRLRRGNNNITVSGHMLNFSITSVFAKGIGA